MRTRACFVICLLCAALLSSYILPEEEVRAQTDWTKHPANPVLVNGGPFEWDMAIMHPSVVEEMVGYKMFFTAQNLTATLEPRFRIGLANAPDETTWSKDLSNPVMDVGSPGSWEEVGVATPWVLTDITGYRMWYTGLDSNLFPQIGYAMSSDGNSWIKHPSNPILKPGALDDWDGNGTMAPSVLSIGGTFHAWYTGANLSGISRIGYATSSDGISWTKHPNNPVLDAGAPGEWDSGGVALPCVIFDGTKYRMWYMGSFIGGFPDVGYAVSLDGINWTKHYQNPILTKGSVGEWDEMMIAGASVLQKSGKYHMWFGGVDWVGGSGIGYANSTAIPNRPPALSGGSVSPNSGVLNGTYAYEVEYRDEDNDPPLYIKAWINKSGVPVGASPYDMMFNGWNGARDNWSAGASFAVSLNLSLEGADYTYTFEASDGEEIVFLPEQIGPTVSTPFDPPGLVAAWLSGVGGQDVTLEWTASANDTGPGGIVEKYDIYVASSFDPAGIAYSVLTSIPASGQLSYLYQHFGAGEGDPLNYFYLICAVNSINATNCAVEQAGKFTQPLSRGPNLVSIPLIQSDEPIQTVLQTVSFDKAWSFDPTIQDWKSSATTKPYAGGLTHLNHTVGFWLNVTSDSNFTVAGVVPSSTMIHLSEGWNLISFPSFKVDYIAANLALETNATRIETFFQLDSPYHLRELNAGDYLLAGYGYWIEVKSEVTWTIGNE